MHKEIIRTILNSILALATMLSTAFLYQTPLALSVILFAIGILMMKLEADRHAIVVYIIGLLFGPISEIIAMMNGAWYYPQQHILTIPIWLPFIWGNAALYINRLNRFTKFIWPNKDHGETLP